ncbi:PepSY-associated TM helix domain-containing protein [Methylosinus sp. LW4]|uniref:PepSY-associated TM helix domain-containing protein n=1 Tax=Methylosinus sp. LW4 TaxID=136993 RepID=UPI00036697FA|nr:PepSY-associated TM helix domain-containing protein [Methylosinus sp. LW4]
MGRAFWIALHRWAGLAMAGFLVIVGLTGSVLAFREQIDVWLNPQLLTVATRDVPTLDPLELRARAAALYPSARIDDVSLDVERDRSYMARVWMKEEGEGGSLIFLYLDPHTGERLGTRTWGVVSLDRKNLLFFLYRLHYTLALPPFTGSFGRYLLGVTALVWTIDCFVAFYLTLPPRRRDCGKASYAAKSWWDRWRPAWWIKFGGGAFRINFDIHRAVGLWTWAMLLVFAWSGVGFNLDEVYRPTMKALFGFAEVPAALPALAEPLEAPFLDWRAARAVGRRLLDEQARRVGFVIESEALLTYDRSRGVYALDARCSPEIAANTRAMVVFDADSGALRAATWPGDSAERAGNSIGRWLARLHTASVFGLPMKILVCAMGLAICALSVTGVYIWRKKRKARRFRKTRGVSAGGAPRSETTTAE